MQRRRPIKSAQNRNPRAFVGGTGGSRKVRLFLGVESHTMWPLCSLSQHLRPGLFREFQVYGEDFMQRFTILGLLGVAVITAVLLSCANQPAEGEDPTAQPVVDDGWAGSGGDDCDDEPEALPTPRPAAAREEDGQPGDIVFFGKEEKDTSDAETKYEAALSQALGLLAERKFEPALEALESAKSYRDTDFIRGEIDKLKGRI